MTIVFNVHEFLKTESVSLHTSSQKKFPPILNILLLALLGIFLLVKVNYYYYYLNIEITNTIA